jgi:alpha-glucosidase
MVSSEGGVGRGLQPLTDLLNTEKKARQGGSPLTTYAPAYSFTTSNRRGFVWPDHTEIGSLDFWSNPNWFNVNMWKTNQMTFHVIQAPNLKKVVSGITRIIGRMRALPRWTQDGAIVGLQGGQYLVQKNYKFLRHAGVPMTGVWMQDWVGTKDYDEGTRLNWNWKLNNQTYP